MRRPHHRPGSKDPAAVHAAMSEAAHQVNAILSERVSTGTPEDPMVRAMRHLNDAIAAVPPLDLRTQRVLTDRLRHLHARLLDDPLHERRGTVTAWRTVTGHVLPVPSPGAVGAGGGKPTTRG